MAEINVSVKNLIDNPKIVIILSGKRKSGKDHIANILQKNLKNFVIIKIAGPIKKEYAKQHNLDYEEMLSDSPYKEKHRLQMVTWSEEIRKKDHNYFLRISIKENAADQFPIWILNDARRQGDVDYFYENPMFKNVEIITIRIIASNECRKRRGFVFTENIDDKPTECGLDEYDNWSYIIENEDLSEKQIVEQLKNVIEKCKHV